MSVRIRVFSIILRTKSGGISIVDKSSSRPKFKKVLDHAFYYFIIISVCICTLPETYNETFYIY